MQCKQKKLISGTIEGIKRRRRRRRRFSQPNLLGAKQCLNIQCFSWQENESVSPKKQFQGLILGSFSQILYYFNHIFSFFVIFSSFLFIYLFLSCKLYLLIDFMLVVCCQSHIYEVFPLTYYIHLLSSNKSLLYNYSL